MNTLKRTSAICLAALLVSVSGCMTTPAAHQESAGEYMSDSWITTKVKAALVDDTTVRATEVNVETFKGIVQLSGFVSSGTAMAQAVRVASGIKGVTSVKNDMRVK
jgi:hyperosmotically inducible protein